MTQKEMKIIDSLQMNEVDGQTIDFYYIKMED